MVKVETSPQMALLSEAKQLQVDPKTCPVDFPDTHKKKISTIKWRGDYLPHKWSQLINFSH